MMRPLRHHLVPSGGAMCKGDKGRVPRTDGGGGSTVVELAMPWYEAFALMIGAVLALMALGLPVAFAFIAANVVGAFVFLGGERGIAQLINNSSSALTNFALVPVPLFLLMGELFFHTGLATRVFDAIDKLMGRVPARLLILAGLYALLILVLVRLAPRVAPAYDVAPVSLLTKVRLLFTDILPMGLVVFL